MAERNDKGHFLPGNKISKLGGRTPMLKDERKPVKEEVIKCAQSLSKPWATLKEEIKDERATRLEYLTAHAVSSKNYKFIQWLLEMAVGKPKQTFDVEENVSSSRVVITLPDNGKSTSPKLENNE